MREQVQNIEPMDTEQLLSREDAEYQAQFVPQWKLNENSIERTVTLPDFRGAIDFVDRVADIADALDHHPDIHVFYNKVRLENTNHKAGGLTLKDFILANALDQVV
jgi:4a-hydroxytetrahydrobiopterin dehydratase